MTVLDVHAHVYPAPFVEQLRARGGASASLADRVTAMTSRNRHFGDAAVDERLELMAAAGIEQQVLSMPTQSVAADDAEAYADHARASNDALAAVCDRYPGRFLLFANLPLPGVDAAAREWERVRQAYGARGVIFPTHVLGRALDWEALEPVYRYLEEQGVLLFLHPGPPPYAPRAGGGKEHGLASALYYPVEDADAMLRLACGGVLERHPRLRIICPHLGGPLPFLLERIDLLSQPSMPDGSPLPHPPSHYLKRQVLYDTVSLHDPAMRCACETWGADHLVLGTDFPYVDGPGMRRIMQTIEALPASPVEREGVRSTNAQRWLPSA